jgi:EAL domain-containing protein (putative c-di-GMP-specific phosphodiesterase class I)
VEKKPCVFATKELSRRVYRQKKIIDSFPGALEQEEFVVYYQPKVNTDNCRMVGAEALVRWIRDGKMVPPGDFVPIVEQDGSVCRLDFYVLEHVCRDIRRWLDQGLEPVRVSVNFSRKHLSNPHLAGDIMAVIGRYHVPVEYIEIEVTETTDEEEQGMLSRFLVEMREQRITTAIDDFGTGYSSLNVLRSFPVDVLKIDKSFIDAGTSTENDEIVLSHIIHMAQDLHMEVITEGVESWEQAKFLRAMDCNLVQGFLFDRPMPPADFERKLHEKQYAVGKL